MSTISLKGAITVFDLFLCLNHLQIGFLDRIVNFRASLNNLGNLLGGEVISKSQIGPLQMRQLLR